MNVRPLRLVFACTLILLVLSGTSHVALAAPSCTGMWRAQKGPIAGDDFEEAYAVDANAANDVWVTGDAERQVFIDHWDGTTWSPTPAVVGRESHPTSIEEVTPSDVWVVGYQGGQVPTVLAVHWNGKKWSEPKLPGEGRSELDAVAAVTSHDVWAVGEGYSSGKYKPIAVHWNGSKWSDVPTASIGSKIGYLNGLVALSTSDVWAVGQTDDGTRLRTLIEHWDGASWTVVDSPNATGDNQLTRVAAVSPTELWAVGASSSGGTVTPLTLHYTGGSWGIVSAPRAGGDNTTLQSVAAVSAGNVWAVGAADDGTRTTTVAEHWDGTSWSVSSTPNAGTKYDALLGVFAVNGSNVFAAGATFKGHAMLPLVESWDGSSWSAVVLSIGAENWLRSASAISATDIWAVGSQRSGTGWRPLAEHYDGTAWSVVPTDTTQDNYVVLTGVATVGTNNVWAVGQHFDGTLYQPLAEHWDGTDWTIVSTPDLGDLDGYLQSVAVVSANDVWAVGETYDGSRFRPLLEHWDGTAWSVDSSLAAMPGDAQLEGVAALASNDVWAVGSQGTSDVGTLALHWDGSSWSEVDAVDVGDTNVLTSVSGTGGGNVWAVGYRTTGSSTTTLVEHWDGSGWAVAPSPNPADGMLNVLLSIDARTPSDVWASGFSNTGAMTKTLVLHYDGSSWSLDPSPNISLIDSNDLDAIVSPAAGQVWAVGNQAQLGLQLTLCPITVTNAGFAPAVVSVAEGGLITWLVPDSAGEDHKVGDATGMGLFSSGSLAPGSLFSFQFSWAGVFQARDGTTGNKGTVKVALAASPKTGKRTDPFTVTYATQPPPPGYVEDIQIKRPGSHSWTDWMTGLAGTTATFTPDAGPGKYKFRASMRQTANGARTGWSSTTITAT